MLRQSSPKNITYHFNSSQKTIAERYALTQYFKNTRLDLRTSNILISSTLTVDQFISKTIILLRISHYCTEKCDLSFQLTYHMISVRVSALFKKLFITEAISTHQSLLYRKILHQLTYHMISVPYTFQKTFHYEINQGKNVDVQRVTVCKKIPLIGEKSRWSMLLSGYSRSSI